MYRAQEALCKASKGALKKMNWIFMTDIEFKLDPYSTDCTYNLLFQVIANIIWLSSGQREGQCLLK